VVPSAAEIEDLRGFDGLTEAASGKAFEERERTNGELVGNVDWVKTALKRRSPRGSMATESRRYGR